MYELITERCFLRMLSPSDLDDLALIFGNPRVMKYLDVDCQPLTRQQTAVVITSVITNWEKSGFGRWGVVSLEDNKLIGLAGFRSHEDIAELFYVLDEPYWGKGLATEIARSILQDGFKRHHFPRIIALTRPGNAASRRVMSKLGMRFTGEINVYGITAVEYEILKEDFQPEGSSVEPACLFPAPNRALGEPEHPR